MTGMLTVRQQVPDILYATRRDDRHALCVQIEGNKAVVGLHDGIQHSSIRMNSEMSRVHRPPICRRSLHPRVPKLRHLHVYPSCARRPDETVRPQAVGPQVSRIQCHLGHGLAAAAGGPCSGTRMGRHPMDAAARRIPPCRQGWGRSLATGRRCVGLEYSAASCTAGIGWV